MTLITRLGRLFRADLNAVLDGLEEPAMVLRQAIRDMQAVLLEEQAEQTRLLGESQRLAQARDEHRQRLAALDEELTLCLAAGQDTLARDLVRRKLEAGRHGSALEARLSTLDEAQRHLARRVAEHGQRLDALRAEASVYEAMPANATEPAPTPWPAAAAISEAEIEVALLRERTRRAQS